MDEEGKKFDAGKLRWGLVPWRAMEQVTKALMFGATRYGDNNWRKVKGKRDRYFEAAMRHLVCWYSGEETDSDSGLSHLAHAACNILFLIEGSKDE